MRMAREDSILVKKNSQSETIQYATAWYDDLRSILYGWNVGARKHRETRQREVGEGK
jgi:hypothetical protein